MATKLRDIDLLSRISGGDLVAIEAKYHSKCFERKTVETPIAFSTSSELVQAQVFTELVYFVETGIEEGGIHLQIF